MMTEEKAKTNHDEETCCDKPTLAESKERKPAGCCEAMMAESADGCPCKPFIRKHWGVVLGIFSLMILAFLISQVGGILGLIAFVRTL